MKTQIITDDVFFIDIIRYCEKNQISDIDEFTSKCLKSGFYVEKYGMLGENSNLHANIVEVIKEVEKIVEVPVDRVVEKIVEKIVEVPVDRVVEKIVEVIREVPIYKDVIKKVDTGNIRVEVKEIEVIKEVPIIKEVFVIKEVPSDNTDLVNELNDVKMTLNLVSEELNKKNKIIEDYRRLFADMNTQSARFYKTSNIKIR
jgi:hypothetical protein